MIKYYFPDYKRGTSSDLRSIVEDSNNSQQMPSPSPTPNEPDKKSTILTNFSVFDKKILTKRNLEDK